MRRHSTRSKQERELNQRLTGKGPDFKKSPALSVFMLFYFAASFLLAGPTPTPSPGPAEQAFLKGIGFKESGRLTEAEGQIKRALELEPANADYHFELANVYAMRRDARAKFSKRDDPEDPILAQTARELEQAVMLRPDFLAAHYNLGVVYKKQGRYEKARETFRRVLELDSRQSGALMQIGATYEEQGFFEDAESFYQEAREKDPANPDIVTALEDLKRHEAQAYERSQAQGMAEQYSRMQSEVRRAPLLGQGIQTDESQNSQNFVQTIPYLGAWLIDEFMKRRSRNAEDP